jgi:hypothetical protein
LENWEENGHGGKKIFEKLSDYEARIERESGEVTIE